MPEDIKELLIKFKIAVLILVLGAIVAIYLLMQTIPVIQNIISLNKEYKTQITVLADKQRTLADLEEAAKRKNDISGVAKEMFSSSEGGLDTETLIAQEFTEVLQLVRANSIKTRSVKYDYDPADDNFIKGAPGQFSACLLSLEMVATYKDFENFLRELYKHEHFLDISKVEMVPYQKNKSILLISFQMKLYAKK